MHFFFAPAKPRVAVSGEVRLDGEAVSWGSLSFRPADDRLPTTTVRVRNGKFSTKAEEGPLAVPSKLDFEGSIWEATGAEADKAVRLEKLTPSDPEPLSLTLAEGGEPLRLEFRSR